MDEEWRVSLSGCVQLAGEKRVSAGTVRDLLGSRADGEVCVTAGKAGIIFLYAATADAAAAAAGVAREVLAQQGLAADIRVERWEPSDRAWLPPGDAAGAEPPGQERGPGRRRLRAAGAVIAAMIDGIGSAGS